VSNHVGLLSSRMGIGLKTCRRVLISQAEVAVDGRDNLELNTAIR